MKYFFLVTIFILSTSLFANAQFTGDPANPLPICNATGTQDGVSTLPDSHGGAYVFWIDQRSGVSGESDIYAQHITANGVAKWTANGQLLISGDTKAIYAFKCVPWQNGWLMAWMHASNGYPDSIFCQYLDTTGAAIWPNRVLVANSGGTSSNIELDSSGFNILPNSLGATIPYSTVEGGGYDFFSFNRIDFSGKLRWALNNFSFTYAGTDNYRSYSDGFGGVYALYRDNGIGTPMYIQRYDTGGTALFSTLLNFTAGLGGVSNSGGIFFSRDAAGNLYITWDDNLNKVYITKITPAGNFAWTPAYKDVSNYASTQAGSFSAMINGKIYTIWTDGRTTTTANATIYIQKTDTTGSNEWTPGGVKLCALNLYSASPAIIAGDSGSVVVAYQVIPSAQAIGGLYGQKIRADSTLKFPVNGQQITDQNHQPDYADFKLIDNGNGCTSVVLSNSAGNIYGAQLCSAVVTGVETPLDETTFHLYPNPSSSLVSWSVPATEVTGNLLLNITDLSGRQVYSANIRSSTGTIDVSAFSKGMYIFQTVSGKTVYSRKLIVE